MNKISNGAPLAYSIKEASRATSLGRTKIYQLIASRRLDVIRIGKRTLIPAQSLHQLLEDGQ